MSQLNHLKVYNHIVFYVHTLFNCRHYVIQEKFHYALKRSLQLLKRNSSFVPTSDSDSNINLLFVTMDLLTLIVSCECNNMLFFVYKIFSLNNVLNDHTWQHHIFIPHFYDWILLTCMSCHIELSYPATDKAFVFHHLS